MGGMNAKGRERDRIGKKVLSAEENGRVSDHVQRSEMAVM